MEFMRRNYTSLCFDMSGNLERYSLEIMHESKRIFLVCTPEIPSLHLAREKYLYLKQLDLGERVSVLLNRCPKRSLISPQQIEQLLGVPIYMTFPNDYQGVQRAMTAGRWVDTEQRTRPSIYLSGAEHAGSQGGARAGAEEAIHRVLLGGAGQGVDAGPQDGRITQPIDYAVSRTSRAARQAFF